MRPPASRPAVVATALLVLALLAAACSGGGDGSADAPDAALQPVGTEAWLDPDAPAVAAAETSDPTAAGAVELGPSAAPGASASPDPAAEGAPAALPGSAGAGSGGPVAVDAGVEAALAAMTLEQKVGQVFTAVVVGDDATDVSTDAQAANRSLHGVATPAEVVATYHLGGVVYLAHDLGARTSNVADLTATARLSAGLQAAAAADSGIGLLIGTDQEGGRVIRLREPAVTFPAARRIGEIGDPDLAREVGAATASQARAVGVNWVYAPVADVNVDPANPVIGDRAFGVAVEGVTPFVAATAEGLAAGGVLPTLKHFPGHGDTDVDSHSSLPVIDHDRAELQAVDLPPFAVAPSLAAGGTPVSVMVGHLAVPAVDPSGRPATISRPVMDLLRADPTAGGMGFDGLVVTDAMNMGALQGFGTDGQLAVGALQAGIDVVLMPVDLPAAWTAVRDAVLSGELPQARLDEAVRRVLQAKAALGVLDARAIAVPDPSGLGDPASRAVRDRVRAACGC